MWGGGAHEELKYFRGDGPRPTVKVRLPPGGGCWPRDSFSFVQVFLG